MRITKVFYVATNDYGFRPGEKGEIIGIKWVKPESDLPWRVCYIVLYKDGTTDLVPTCDIENYRLI